MAGESTDGGSEKRDSKSPVRDDCHRLDSDRWWLVAGLRRPDTGGTEVLTERVRVLECWEDARLTSLLGDRRWLDGRERIGLAEPLNDGVIGLLAEGLSLWKDTIDNRRSQPVDGRRECEVEGESVDSFSGIRKGGLVRV